MHFCIINIFFILLVKASMHVERATSQSTNPLILHTRALILLQVKANSWTNYCTSCLYFFGFLQYEDVFIFASTIFTVIQLFFNSSHPFFCSALNSICFPSPLKDTQVLVQKSRLNFSLYSAVRLFASPVNFCNVCVKANSSSLNGV